MIEPCDKLPWKSRYIRPISWPLECHIDDFNLLLKISTIVL